ncbi:MAG: Unknown protein [uncultured Campylobacterales bacterium]|uniref:DUF1761 domain-containing protein n=1 Tax=uncultured Campylobacterales bacterium TaxID=352960 RepID=A0A6S6SER9_9BACT|nr:MAG: Unknown protein [uncultured Campylobacterales bacterium]
MKKTLLAIGLIFVSWFVIDFLVHGVALVSLYDSTAQLWRAQEDMNVILIHSVTLFTVFGFVLIYSELIANKSMGKAIQYSFIFGAVSGVSMGFGSFAYMPIPFSLALSWFGVVLFECMLGGVILGLIYKNK